LVSVLTGALLQPSARLVRGRGQRQGTQRPEEAVTTSNLEFQEFFASQYGRLCWVGYLLTGSRAEAEELAQDALVRTWRRWALVRRPDDPTSYARKVLINRHRSRLRRLLLEARHAGHRHDDEVPGPDQGDDALVLWTAVRELPARQRAVLVLRYHEDLTEAEVARLLRLPLGTVKSLAHRGLARLRAELVASFADRAWTGREEP
jgi:RNA polymerase sigma-70 factor (sigma-E family)